MLDVKRLLHEKPVFNIRKCNCSFTYISQINYSWEHSTRDLRMLIHKQMRRVEVQSQHHLFLPFWGISKSLSIFNDNC